MKLVKYSTDALESKLENGCITVSPDVTAIHIKWEEKPGTGKALFEQLLTAYRSTNLFEGVDDKGFQIVREQEPFLLESEKKNLTDILGFDFVIRTFLHEFDRRREENLRNGYELYKVAAPPVR